MKKHISNIMYLTKYIWKFKKSIFLYVVVCGLIQAVKVGTNIVGIKYIIDSVIAGDLENIIWIIAFYCLINMLCDFFVTHSNSYTTKSFSYIAMNMTKEVMDKSIEIDYKCFDDSEYYDKYTRAMSQAGGAAQRLVGTYISIASNLISLISIIGIMLTMIGIEFIIISLVNVAISCFILMIQNKWQYDFDVKMTRLNRIIGYFPGLFFNPKTAKEIRLFGSSNFFINKYTDHQNESIEKTKQFQKKYYLPDYLKALAFAITSFLTMLLISFKITKGQLTLGVFMSTINSVQSLTQQLCSLTYNVPSLTSQSRYIDNIRAILDHPGETEIENEMQRILVKKNGYKIEFKNVSFKYPNSDNFVVRNLNFIVNEGEHICLVGENGAGKTTIVKLLLRLYIPQEGEILIDDVNINDYKISSLRNNFSVVFQDSQIYATKVGENLFFDEEYQTAEAHHLLQLVGLSERFKIDNEFVDSQLTRLFDEQGIVLSGGQAQRLFIARAYGAKSGIIILDEPSSSLDPLSEYELVKTMDSLLNENTTFVISHRFLFCKNMDKIFHIENGSLIESGTHKELMAKRGKYFEMYEKQAEYYRENNLGDI